MIDQAILKRVLEVSERAGREYFGSEVPPQEILELLERLLNGPRHMWLSLGRGLITREELVSGVASQLHTFLRQYSSKALAEPDLLAENMGEFLRVLESAFFPRA